MKKIIINLLLFLFSLLFIFLILNYILIILSKKQNIPRILAGSLPNYYFTFYPDTYEKHSTDKYIAVLGDSYAQGSGDAYLNGKYDYSVSHFLKKETNLDFLNFGRGGYGSISSVLNLVRIINFSSKDIFNKKIPDPEKILFFFFEGNDLTENYQLFKSTEFIDAKTYFNFELKNFNNQSKNFNSEINFPIINYIQNLFERFFFIFKKINNLNDFQSYLIEIYDRIKGSPKSLIRNYSEIENIKKNKTTNNFILPQLESGFTLLNQESIDLSLDIFYNSLDFLKSRFPQSQINIIYIPSLPSIYKFENDINVWSNWAKKNGYENLVIDIETYNFYSNYVRDSLKFNLNKKKIEFLDLTSFLQDKTKKDLIHGPLDYHHFNNLGYKFISEIILKYIF